MTRGDRVRPWLLPAFLIFATLLLAACGDGESGSVPIEPGPLPSAVATHRRPAEVLRPRVSTSASPSVDPTPSGTSTKSGKPSRAGRAGSTRINQPALWPPTGSVSAARPSRQATGVATGPESYILRASDLGDGFTPGTVPSQGEHEALNACLGLPPMRLLPENSAGATFYGREPGTAVMSRATVAGSPDQARALQAPMRTGRGRECLADIIRKQFVGEAPISLIRLEDRPLPVPSEHGIALRLRITVSLSGVDATVVLDYFSYVVGNTEVVGQFTREGDEPDADISRRLLQLMINRVSSSGG